MWTPKILLFLAMLAHSMPALCDGTRVVYPAYETASDTRFNDLIEILQLSLEKSVPEFGPFELAPSATPMNEARYLGELKQGAAINVAWSSTSVEKERDFLPLRIPLRKGILSYRIAFINKDQQARIDQVQTIEDLRKLSIGQGIGWGDTRLYEASGIHVTQARYGNLFRMVGLGRFDLFPRGIAEIFPEYAVHSRDDPNLAIEKNLLIYYPWPYYFFFHHKDTVLANRIETGILKMKKDGSFDAIFKKYNGKAIAQANFKGRRVIRIPNDMLPKETPLDDASLWFDPAKDTP